MKTSTSLLGSTATRVTQRPSPLPLTEPPPSVSGVHLSRDLGNCPPNDMYPMAFAEKAEQWAKQYDNVKVEVIDYEAAKRHGMGGLVAVGMGVLPANPAWSSSPQRRPKRATPHAGWKRNHV